MRHPGWILSLLFILIATAVSGQANPEIRAYAARRISVSGANVVVSGVALEELADGDWEVMVPEHRRWGHLINTRDLIFDETMIKAAGGVTAQPAGGKGGAANVLKVELNPVGTQRLSEYSKANINQPIAIRFNGRWINIPTIKAQIRDGRVIILDLQMDEIEAVEKHFAGR